MSAYTSQNYGAGKFIRIRDGLKVTLSIAAVSYIILGSLMVFAPGFLARILLQGSAQIRLACMFLPRCGFMMIFVDVLFVVRNCVQGMGKPMLPMASGILEMILRIFVISFLMSRLGFKATAYAEISAWIGALAVNGYALYKYLTPLVASEKSEAGEEENIFHGKWRGKLHGTL